MALAVALLPHWEAHGQFAAGRDTLATVLALPDVTPTEQAAALGALAQLALAQGDFGSAVDAYERVLELRQLDTDAIGLASTQHALAAALALAGDLERAREQAEAALRGGGGDARHVAFVHATLAMIDRADGRIDEARHHLLISFELLRSERCKVEAAAVLVQLANLAADTDDSHSARRFYDGALQLFEANGDRRGAALCLNNLSIVAARQGDLDHAVELVERARALFAASGDRHGEAGSANNLAAIREEQGLIPAAAELYQQTAATLRELGDSATAETVEANLARLRPEIRRHDHALSARERQVATLVAAGLSNREIAKELFVSQRTIDSHVAHMFTKLGIKSRARLASMWAEAAVMA